MTLSLALTIVVILVTVGFTGLCTFNPGRPEMGPVQEVDPVPFLSMEARAMSFPVRLPENPEGWVPNSARRTQIDQHPAPVVGWVTPDTGYIQLTQTDHPVGTAVNGYDGEFRELERTENVSGEQVEVYSSGESDVRDLWVADLGETRLLFSGAATDEEFHTLIDATVSTDPLPSGA